MTAIARYRTALAHPGTARVMGAAFACRMLAGMVSLALLLVAKDASGSYAGAGLVSGGYALALAATSPLWGRVADRRGPRTALAWSTSLQSLAFGLFVLIAATSGWPPLLTLTAAVAGAATPPAAAVSNATVMSLVKDEEDRRTLFALSGLLTESVFIGGPLLVGVIVVLLPALYAVVVTAAVSSAGVWWLRSSPGVRQVDRERPRLSGPGLRLAWDGRQLHIQLVVAAAAFAIGGLQVSVVAQAGRIDAGAGVLLAALACGGVIGSFLYGGLRLPGTNRAQLAVGLALYGGLIMTVGAGSAALVTVLVLVLIGFVNGPADAIETVLVGEYAQESTRSQAFAVLVASNWVGFAAGSAVTGAVVQHVSAGLGAVVAGAAALAAAASLLLPTARAHAVAAPVPEPVRDQV